MMGKAFTKPSNAAKLFSNGANLWRHIYVAASIVGRRRPQKNSVDAVGRDLDNIISSDQEFSPHGTSSQCFCKLPASYDGFKFPGAANLHGHTHEKLSDLGAFLQK